METPVRSRCEPRVILDFTREPRRDCGRERGIFIGRFPRGLPLLKIDVERIECRGPRLHPFFGLVRHEVSAVRSKCCGLHHRHREDETHVVET